MSAAARPLRILELRTVRGTGGGPDKTILLGTARTNTQKYAVTICYIRDARDDIFNIDQRARQLPVTYIEVIERNSLDWRVWPQLRRIIREREIDIIHAHDYKTDLLALLLGKVERVLAVSTAHGWGGLTDRELRYYYPLDRRVLPYFDHVIAVASIIRNTLLSYGARPERVSVVLNGVEPDRFRRDRSLEAQARAQFQLPADALVVCTVGRLELEKNFPMLIRAFARVAREVPRAVLVIAGDGSLRGELERGAAAAGLSADQFRLLGLIDNVAQLHHAIDVYVQSSDLEGTSNAVLEAMSLETPIVATDVGGTSEVARHGQEALIIPKGDENALVAAVLDVVTRPDAARSRVGAARARVETELSFDLRTRRLEAIYDEVASRAGVRARPMSVHA